MEVPVGGDPMVHDSPSRLRQRIGLDTSSNEVDSLSRTNERLELPVSKEDFLCFTKSLVRLHGLLDGLASLLGQVWRICSKALGLLVHGCTALQLGDIRILFEVY